MISRLSLASLCIATSAILALAPSSADGADLLGYWDFNDDALPGAERSGSGPDVEVSAAASLTADAGGRSGSPGDRGLDLGSHNNEGFASTPAGPHFDDLHTGNAYSVVLWQVNRQIANSSSFWVQAPASSGGQRGIQAHIPWGNGTIFYDQSGCCGPGERLTVAGQVVLNQWQHFVFQRDAAGNRSIWVDGTMVADSGGADPLEPVDGVLSIGADPNGANSLDGIVDDFAIFNGPLTEEEIAALAAGGSPLDLVVDSDNDGMPDSYELANGLDKDVDDAADDADGDGLTNFAEFQGKTDPQNADTDGDGVSDGAEVANGTDPLDSDTDDDGRNDGEEASDGTDPLDPDSDDDGLDDGQEATLGTNPLESDSDGDGVSDGEEVEQGTDPLDNTSFPDSTVTFTAAVGRFVEVVKNSTAETHLHLSEIEVFEFGVTPDRADGDGTSQNDLVQAGSPSVQVPPTTTDLAHGSAGTVYDGDLEAGAEVWTTANDLGVEPRYMLDLGATHSIGEVRLWGRNDECCTSRLENFTVNVYADDGAGLPGELVHSVLFPDEAPSADIGPAELNLAVPDPGIRSFTVDKPFVPAGEPITLSWEVNPNATGVTIDNEVGDVTAQTDETGAGSLLIDPGPSEDTIYRMVVTRPVGNSAAAVSVKITGQPVIFTFEADQNTIDPGTEVQLTWGVANVTALDLNGTDVTGTTGLAVSPSQTTAYTLTATNESGTTSKRTRVRVVIPGEPVISEFMADNRGEVTTDEDGDSSDWIELCNPSDSEAVLDGYFLTDDPGNLSKWRIPDVRIAAGGYLLVFASGKDRANPNSELHTDFSLQDGGEYLALVKPDGVTVVVDFWPEFPKQRPEVSYGFEEQSIVEGFFLEPTPGARNRKAFTGFVGDTMFSLDRGFYDAPIRVDITTSEPDAEIRYTRDGSIPTERTGLIYEGPIAISRTTILRAAGFKEGFVPTNVDTQTYFFTTDIIRQPTMRTSITQHPTYGPRMPSALKSIPSLSLVFDGDISRTEKPCSVEFINFEAGSIQHDVGMSRFGNYVTDFSKRGMRLSFRSEYGPTKLRFPVFDGHDYEIEPAAEVDALDLRSGNHDMAQRGAYMSNRFTDDTMLDMGNIAPHGRFVHVYVNGSYNGHYHMRERWNAAMFAEYFPGRKEDYESINANNSGWQFQVGTPTDGSGRAWQQAQSVVRGPQPFSRGQRHIDYANVIDFMLLWVSGNSESEFRAAGSPALGVPFKFFMKDADGFLRTPDGNHPVTHQGPLNVMQELMSEGDPDFEILLADRIHKHYFNNGAFTPRRNIARLQARVDEIETAFFAEAARWNERTPSSWQSYQDNLLRSYFPRHTQTMIDKFRSARMYPRVDAPVFERHGGVIAAGFELTMEAPEGRIYYTLDGTDPRRARVVGELSDTAVLYEGAVSLDATTTVKSRALVGTNWSALNEATFVVSTAGLVVSEFMYNPAAATAAEIAAGFNDSEDFEFFELHNIGSNPIDLTGVKLDLGISFGFATGSITELAPGGHVLVVEDEAAFEFRYGAGLPVAGQYTGKLSDSGETVRLSNVLNTPLIEFTYDNVAPWPVEAAGSGASLVLANPAANPDHNDPASWIASAVPGGTPGRGELTTVDFATWAASNGVTDPAVDEEGDGLTNFEEFVRGTLPLQFSVEPKDEVRIESLEVDGVTRDYATFTFTYSATAGGLDVRAEISEDLLTWNGGPGFTEHLRTVFHPDGSATATWRSASPIDGQDRQFMRAIFESR